MPLLTTTVTMAMEVTPMPTVMAVTTEVTTATPTDSVTVVSTSVKPKLKPKPPLLTPWSTLPMLMLPTLMPPMPLTTPSPPPPHTNTSAPPLPPTASLKSTSARPKLTPLSFMELTTPESLTMDSALPPTPIEAPKVFPDTTHTDSVTEDTTVTTATLTFTKL